MPTRRAPRHARESPRRLSVRPAAGTARSGRPNRPLRPARRRRPRACDDGRRDCQHLQEPLHCDPPNVVAVTGGRRMRRPYHDGGRRATHASPLLLRRRRDRPLQAHQLPPGGLAHEVPPARAASTRRAAGGPSRCPAGCPQPGAPATSAGFCTRASALVPSPSLRDSPVALSNAYPRDGVAARRARKPILRRRVAEGQHPGHVQHRVHHRVDLHQVHLPDLVAPLDRARRPDTAPPSGRCLCPVFTRA